MNSESKKIIDLTRRHLSFLLNDENVTSAMITGSAAKGYADKNSDADCSIFTKEQVNEDYFEFIKEKAVRTGGGFYHGTPEEGFAVYEFEEGRKIDYGIMQESKFEEMLKDYFKDPDIGNSDLQLIASGFSVCVPFKGEYFVNNIKKYLSGQLNDSYTEKLIKYHMRFPTKFEMLEMTYKRGETIQLYESLLTIYKNIIGILYGLNKMFHPGKIKGNEYYIRQMKIIPPNFSSRFEFILKNLSKESIADAYDLILQTYDLIDIHRPEMKTEQKRKNLDITLRR